MNGAASGDAPTSLWCLIHRAVKNKVLR